MTAHSCPCCQTAMANWFVKADRALVRCPGCRLIVVPAGVMQTASGTSIYEDDDNIFTQQGNLNYYLDDSHMMSFTAKLTWVQAQSEGTRLLDVGANFGHFLKAAGDAFDGRGIELSPQAVAWSKEHFAVDNRVASIYELPADLGAPFDVVTCWDVVEHLPDPVAAIEALRELVKPGGFLFLSTPDAGSLTARLLGKRWHYIDPIQHITLFNRQNLTRLLQDNGFAVTATRSFGHYYRLRYIFDRLSHLYPHGPISWLCKTGECLLSWAMQRIIYLKLGDVMGIAARRIDEH